MSDQISDYETAIEEIRHRVQVLERLVKMLTEKDAAAERTWPGFLTIVRHSAEYFGTRVGEVVGPHKTRRTTSTRARRVACYLAHHETAASFLEIAKALDLHHSTVLYCERWVSERIGSDDVLAAEVSAVRTRLRA